MVFVEEKADLRRETVEEEPHIILLNLIRAELGWKRRKNLKLSRKNWL